jgi:hypothetical protein
MPAVATTTAIPSVATQTRAATTRFQRLRVSAGVPDARLMRRKFYRRSSTPGEKALIVVHG